MNLIRKVAAILLGIVGVLFLWVGARLLVIEDCYLSRDYSKLCSYEFTSEYMWIAICMLAVGGVLEVLTLLSWPEERVSEG